MEAPGSIEQAVAQELDLKVGELVVVRPAHEILATLDHNACLDDLPFMPQMLRYCGTRHRVRKRAHKMCDTVFATGARQMTTAVFLDDINCDGEAFGGCEMGCSIVWKEAWLKRADGDLVIASSPADERLKELAWKSSQQARPEAASSEPIYVCQATKLPTATKPLPWWHFNQYAEDYKSGNSSLPTLSARLLFLLYSKLVASGLGFGTALRWLYDLLQSMRGGVPFPIHAGRFRGPGPTPAVDLGLREGDLVRVKSIDQILETVDKRLYNRGMSFHPEMVPYCGKTFRVKQRLRKIMNEKNGQLITLKNSCLILDGAGCHGRFTQPINCPRALPPYWREVWLERVENDAAREAAENGPTRPVIS